MLSDPFQRQRYDAQLEAGSEPSGDVELVDDSSAPQSSGAELTGWRKLLAPPPPKDARATGRRQTTSAAPREANGARAGGRMFVISKMKMIQTEEN